MRHLEEGLFKGDTCNRVTDKGFCDGVIDEGESYFDGCSCHINPPCPKCTEQNQFCPKCGWEADNA